MSVAHEPGNNLWMVALRPGTAGAETAVGVVTIGRNEGARLRHCLALAYRTGRPVVYADSGSTDDSVAFARSINVPVVELDPSRPFTMARGRNAGLELLLREHGETELVQFIDGDCELVEGWIERGVEAMSADPRLGAVWGRRRECDPRASVYNRVCDIEWRAPPGRATACGGDVLVRVDALHQSGLFDARLIAGEELDLCVRLRAHGWRLEHLDHDMTIHDAAMTHFAEWWRRNLRSGWVFAMWAAGLRQAPGRPGLRQSASIWFWALGLPVAMLAMAWPTGGVSLGLLLCSYMLLCRRIWRRRRAAGDDARSALEYALLTVLAKWPQLLGQVQFGLECLRGRPTAPIEYARRRIG
jgi:GT2 family glycosyltransferase